MMKAREHRTRVVLPARMRWDGRWTGATVCNISSGGLMIRSASLPPRGAYVEIELPTGTITARAVWTKGAHCGLRARDKLNPEALLAPGRARASGSPRTVARPGPARTVTRRPAAADRRTSTALQFAALAAAGAMAAAGIGWELYGTLSAPAGAIAATIGGE